jgi:DNA-binding MarR family transcriptional regulator
MSQYQDFFSQYYELYRPLINKLNVHLAQYQLYSSQWAILKLIKNKGPLTFGEIANIRNVEKPTVTRMVQRLYELDFVEIVPGKDKREKFIQITAFGKKQCEEIQLTIDDFYREALSGISEEEMKEVTTILGTVRENILK